MDGPPFGPGDLQKVSEQRTETAPCSSTVPEPTNPFGRQAGQALGDPGHDVQRVGRDQQHRLRRRAQHLGG